MVNRLKNRRDDDRGGRGGGGFSYKERDPKKMKERAEQKGGNFDSIFVNGVDTWRPGQGDNTIRILPPTFEGAEHYGMDVFVHSYVGSDQSTYLCPKKMKGDHCPICAAAAEAKSAGEEEDAKELQVKKQVLVYILDREGDEPEKPVVWAMSWTMDRDIAALCNNKKSGKILSIDHPEKGYDVMFKRTGQKLNTRYIGIQIDRDSSYILEDEKDQDDVLAEIAERPLDTLLKYYDEDYLEKVLDGVVEKKDDDDDDKGGGRRGRGRGRDDDKDKDDDRGSRRRGSRDDDKGDDDRGSRRRGRDDDKDDDKGDDDRGSRRRGRDDDKDDKGDDDRGSRRRGRDDDKDKDDDKGDDDRGSRRRGRGDDDKGDDDRGSRRSRDRDDDKDKDDDDRGSRRRGSRDDKEPDPADDDPKDSDRDSRSSRRGRDDDKDADDDRGSRRRGRDDDKDDDKGGRVRSRR